MIAISENKLQISGNIQEGQFIFCDKCNELHLVKNAVGDKGTSLQYYTCGTGDKLIGLNNKNISWLFRNEEDTNANKI